MSNLGRLTAAAAELKLEKVGGQSWKNTLESPIKLVVITQTQLMPQPFVIFKAKKQQVKP